MTIKQLHKIVEQKIKPRLEQNLGLRQFANERAKFEGWLKVEVIDALNRMGMEAVPEKERIDVVLPKKNVAIELKVVNTNYLKGGVYPTLIDKSRPITKNIASVNSDIEKLKARKNYRYSFVVFVVFPANVEIRAWENHIVKVAENLSQIMHTEFNFNNGIPGIIYIGKV